MFQIAKTPWEKKQNAIYWEQQRKIASDIRDAYEKVQEDLYHSMRYKKNIKSVRPDFFSPLPKNQNRP